MNNASCFFLQFAGLDLQGRGGSSGGRYIPPHLRNKPAGPSTPDSRDSRERGESRGGGSRGYSRGSGGGGQTRDSRQGDFSSFNTRNRRDYQNGDSGERDSWSRGGSRFSDRERDAPRNDRWQDPPSKGGERWSDGNNDSRGGSGNSRWNESAGGGRRNDADWTVPLQRDERLELELFGTGNTGINFSKYEDIPVEATGDQVPHHISSVSKLSQKSTLVTNVLLAFSV